MQLAGAVALITGGSSGIGAATARALASAGARPLIAGRDAGRLEAVANQTGGVALQADLAAPGGPDALAAAALREGGHIDLLVNNAGIGWAGPIGELSAAKVDELIAVNLTAPIQLTRLLAPGMTERRSGRIVFVSSIAGATGVRHEAVYAATKAGLTCFAESVSYELAEHGVGVSLVFPGAIDTPFFERRGTPYQRRRPAPIAPEGIAAVVVEVAEHDQAEAFVPAWMRFPARLHGVAPGTFRALAARFDRSGQQDRQPPEPSAQADKPPSANGESRQ
jgi:short-subunit dehydrogenase